MFIKLILTNQTLSRKFCLFLYKYCLYHGFRTRSITQVKNAYVSVSPSPHSKLSGQIALALSNKDDVSSHRGEQFRTSNEKTGYCELSEGKENYTVTELRYLPRSNHLFLRAYYKKEEREKRKKIISDG